MNTSTKDTAAAISIDDLWTVSNQIDTELTQTFAEVFAQHRTWRKAAAYTDALTACDTPVKTCWELAEKAGHHTPGPFQSLIAENRWDHHEIGNRIAPAVPRLVCCPADDPLGPGLAVDETAQPKRGHHTVGVGTPWAGCLGHTTNCVTSVLAQLSLAAGRDLDRPWAVPFRKKTGSPVPQRPRRLGVRPRAFPMMSRSRPHRRSLAGNSRNCASGVFTLTWAVGDEVYGRSAALRDDHGKNGEAYASFVPKNFLIPTAAGGWHSAQQLGARAQGCFEVRSAGPGRSGPRWSEWAMIEAGAPHHFLLVRQPWSPPETTTTTRTHSFPDDSSPDTSYVYCFVPPESPIRPTLPNLVLMAGRRWPMEETIATGKGPLGWDHHQYRTWTSLCHHTALCGLAMLKATALRASLENTTACPSPPTAFSSPPTEDIPGPRTRLSPPAPDRSPEPRDEVMIPLGDSPAPVLPDQPCPPNIGYIRLTLNETLRLIGIAHAGLSKARIAFHLRWSRWRRRHQAIARWHHYRARLAAQAAPT